MSMIGPVQSRCHEGSPVGKRSTVLQRDILFKIGHNSSS